MEAAEIRVRGRVQGVGFRPAVWRLARELGLAGEVRNDADGVLIRVTGEGAAIAGLLERLEREPPPLARIERIERLGTAGFSSVGFHIARSAGGAARTEIAPDTALCADCTNEVLNPAERRHHYAFANCTQCGPRFSITRGLPYDRGTTTMASFRLCAVCDTEYHNPEDRRFHAVAMACADCGPQARLEPSAPSAGAVATAARMLRQGNIIALKGLGGYQLACDATSPTALARLRAAKHRPTKPFALMARNLAVIRRYCAVDSDEAQLLSSAEAPIVLLRAIDALLPDAIAPGLTKLGFMLPTTPLHLLLLDDMDVPLVMTSGNLTNAPQIIDDSEALSLLGGSADAVLLHDRPIATRIDDSVVRMVTGKARMLRRARGYTPTPIRLPDGFAAAPDLLAAGAEMKNAFCLVKAGTAILSHHIGDLEEAATFDDYRSSLTHYATLFDHTPMAIAADPHPGYLSSRHARTMGLPVMEVQHHHAHVAACMAENGIPLNGPPVLGVVLDGLGWGDDATIWGGEFLLADYRSMRRLAAFRPVAMPGGTAAVREPWRNLYAHLIAAGLDPRGLLFDKPCDLLDTMVRKGLNSPLASSCGRLFDAVAAALGICRDRQCYEGEAAARLEAMICDRTLNHEDDSFAYPMTMSGFRIDAGAMWRSILTDLDRGIPKPVIAARFHKGLAKAIASKASDLAALADFDTVALSGGCFQNAVLFTQTERRLRDAGFAVLSHGLVPANDGGLALGQAAVAAARMICDGV